MSLPGKKQQPARTKAEPLRTTWQGPLPPPEALQKFDAIVQGGAERVFRMAEIEQQHRIQAEQVAIQANIEASRAEIQLAKRGHNFGGWISVLAIVGAIGSVPLGAHWSVSVALVGVPLMSTVRALILRK